MESILSLFLTLILLFNITPIALAQDNQISTVAIYVTGDADMGIKKVIGSKLVSGVTHSNDYAAVERTADFLGELMKEQDYQLSGAVTDSQIAKLGQQFGVQYVLVADISEVFGSMFISARMIDVQTAQIMNSADATQTVTNMVGLTEIADKIVSDILWRRHFSDNELKRLGTFSTARELLDGARMNGYRLLSVEEINDLKVEYDKLGKKLSYPIYTDIKDNYEIKKQYFKVDCYDNDRTSKIAKTTSKERGYGESIIYFTSIDEKGETRQNQCVYIDDKYFYEDYDIWNHPSDRNIYKTVSRGLYNMSKNESITPGFIYFIKCE